MSPEERGQEGDEDRPRDANERAARTKVEVSRFEHVRADPEKRRGGYKALIWLAFLVFIVTLVDMLLLDNMLQWGLLAAYILLFLVGIILLFTTRRTEEVRKRKGDVDTSARINLRCQHCGSVFHADLDHDIEHREAALSCPVCGIFSTLPGRDDVPVDVPVGGRPAKSTPYVCTNCEERVVVGTFANAPHHQVLWKGCPHCGHRGTPRLATAQVQDVERGRAKREPAAAADESGAAS